MKIISIIFIAMLFSCAAHLGRESAQNGSIVAERIPKYKIKVEMNQECQSKLENELKAKYREEYVITSCDSTDLGNLVLVETKKDHEYWKNNPAKLHFGGALLLIVRKECQIDSIIPQY